MLTPYFELSQSEELLFVCIKAPMANIAKTELNVDGNEFIFYSPPYYLRITLPGNVHEKVQSMYDCDEGEFKFTLRKCNVGEYFKDLDLIGKLLNPKKRNLKPEISLVHEGDDSSENEDDSNDWLLFQEPLDPLADLCGPKYGFGDKMEGNTTLLKGEFSEILDLKSMPPDKSEWTAMRQKDEDKRFNEDHYIADFMDPAPLRGVLEFVPTYTISMGSVHKVELTPQEKEYIKNLGNKEYILDASEKRKVLLSLVDILYAYAYNHRTTYGENTVESAWTINKLSSTLSWLQSFSCLRDVKVSCMRRAVTYPLYRHWEIALKVANDTIALLKAGRRQILKCLIEIHTLFNESEPRYLLNQLYITDYCIWIQKVSGDTVGKIADMFAQIHITKSDLEFNLDQLEQAAMYVQEEEAEIDLSVMFRNVVIERQKMTTLDSDDDSDASSEPDLAAHDDESSVEYATYSEDSDHA